MFNFSADWPQIVLIVTMLSSLLKALLEETIPGFKNAGALHDNILRLLNLALCVVLALGDASIHSALTPDAILPLLYTTINAFLGSQGLYFVATRSGSSIGNSFSPTALQTALQALGQLLGLTSKAATAAASTASPSTPASTPVSAPVTPTVAPTNTTANAPTSGASNAPINAPVTPAEPPAPSAG